MTDAGRDLNDVRDEDRLPWLEPVEDEDVVEGPSALKLLVSVIIALVAIGLVVGGVFWLKSREEAPQGDASVIPAPTSPYKVKPAEAGGMKVEGAGDSAYATSEGADQNSEIDLSAMPETALTPGKSAAAPPVHKQAAAPVTPPAATKPEPAPAKSTPPAPKVATPPEPAKVSPKVAPAKPAAATPSETAKVPAAATRTVTEAPPAKIFAPIKAPVATQAPAAGGGTIQLGAFSSEAKANAAWKSLSHRFGFLGSLAPSVTPVSINGSTLYRLRAAAGGEGGTICAKLKVAGETCAVVQ